MKGSQRKQLLSPLSSPPPALQDKGAAGEVRDKALPMGLPAGFAAAAIGKPFREKEPVFSKAALKLFCLRFLRGIPKFSSGWKCFWRGSDGCQLGLSLFKRFGTDVQRPYQNRNICLPCFVWQKR